MKTSIEDSILAYLSDGQGRTLWWIQEKLRADSRHVSQTGVSAAIRRLRHRGEKVVTSYVSRGVYEYSVVPKQERP